MRVFEFIELNKLGGLNELGELSGRFGMVYNS